jgi:lipid-A-disaccharide synthase
MGGDRMEREGMSLICHISDVSVMGFTEVLKNLRVLRSIEKQLEASLIAEPPDVLVLIDYPGFNLRFARRAKERGIRTLYYISPQVWAWNKGRVKRMKGVVDRMKVVFPFEVEIYRKAGIDVEFVGHPLAEILTSTVGRDGFCSKYGFDPQRKLIGLFPGSRRQEVRLILPTMVRVAGELQRSHDVQAGVAVAPNLDRDFVSRFVPPNSGIALIENGTYDLMENADAAIVTSGTATLETGWFGTPMVVVYRTAPVTFFIGRLLVNVPYIGLVNIVAGKKVVAEFVQHAMNPANLLKAVRRLLEDVAYAGMIRNELAVIKRKLGSPGASARVAAGIIALGEAS